MKASRLIVVLLAAVAVVTMAADKPKKLLIGKIPITLAASVHQADVKWEAQYLKEKYKGDYTYIDGKGDATITNTAMEDLSAKNVSGIIINPTDPAAINESVREARKAGIPVITYYMTPTEVKIPWVRVNEAVNAKQMGADAAKKWKELYPNKPIRVGIIEFLTNPQIIAMRSTPFIEGVKSVDPTAQVVAQLDGAGDLQKSVVAAQDMLQSHPEVNLIYATNEEHSLGALSAFQAANRGRAKNGNPLTEIICGTDASQAEILQLINPNSALKFTMGMTPHENGTVQIDTIMKVINGQLPADERTIIDVHDKNFDYWTTNIKTIQDWMNFEYFTNVDLQAELNKSMKK